MRSKMALLDNDEVQDNVNQQNLGSRTAGLEEPSYSSCPLPAKSTAAAGRDGMEVASIVADLDAKWDTIRLKA